MSKNEPVMHADVSVAEADVRRLIEDWAICRDTGDWDRFERLWHPDGRMVATFFDGPAASFIEAARKARSGALVQHVLGGSSVRVQGHRAIAETRMTIHMRVPVAGEPCDIACIGRFLDQLEYDGNRWLLVLRQPIYEKDRLDPVRPGAMVALAEAELAAFPEGYRYTGYVQSLMGLPVNRLLPGTGGAALEPFYAAAEAWLEAGREHSAIDAI